MSFHGYMTISGARHGLISAGCSSQDSMGNRYQVGHEDEIMMLSFSHNLSSLGNTKPIAHRPVLIAKYVDKATPILAEALADRDVINCRLNFYRISARGVYELYFDMELSGGLIVDQRLEMPHAVLQSKQDPQEYLAITYSFISWNHRIAGTSGYASWGDDL